MQSAMAPVTINNETHRLKGPQIRDVPDSLDDVYIPRDIPTMRGNLRTTWRNPHYNPQQQNPYRLNNLRPPGPSMAYPGPYMDLPRQHENFRMLPMNQPVNFPPPANNNFMPDLPPQHIQPYRPALRPSINAPPYKPQNYNPSFESQVGVPPFIKPSPFINKPTDSEESAGNRPPVLHMQPRSHSAAPNLPPPALAGKKVHINPHFKGNLQSLEGLATYIPSRIEKPPLIPRIEHTFGQLSNIDDAAERFIAEQRSALARAATRTRRSPPRRSPPRYSATSESNPESVDYARYKEEELLRRQEEFINRNRAGLRRRMRSPTPPRHNSPPRRAQPTNSQSQPPNTPVTEEYEYKRKVREQESLRDRVMRAKEVRRRKNAVAAQKQVTDKEKEDPARSDKEGAILPQQNLDDKEIKANIKSKDLPLDDPLQLSTEVKGKGISKKVSDIPIRPAETIKAVTHTAKSTDKASINSELPKVTETGQKTAEISPKPAEAARKRQSSPSKKITGKKKKKFQDGDRMTPPLPIPMQLQKETTKTESKPTRTVAITKSSDLKTVKVEVSKPQPSEVNIVKTKAVKVDAHKPQTSNQKTSKPYASKLEVIKLPSEQIESTKPEASRVKILKFPAAKEEATQQLAIKVDASKSEVITVAKTELEELRSAGVERSLLCDDDTEALDLILNEIDDILSDSEGSDLYKELPKQKISSKKGNSSGDLSSKTTDAAQKQKIVAPDKEEAKETVPVQPKKKDLSPPTSLNEKTATKKTIKAPEPKNDTPKRERMKIIFNKKEEVVQEKLKTSFAFRRVILKRSAETETLGTPINSRTVAKSQQKPNPSVPNIGIFSRAVKTALGNSANESKRAYNATLPVAKKVKPALCRQASVKPNIELDADTDDESIDEDLLLRDDDEEPLVAVVSNLPHGMTGTRMTNLAGNEVQKLKLDKEQRSAQITFKTAIAAETFKKKFNNKMVATSRLTVVLR